VDKIVGWVPPALAHGENLKYRRVSVTSESTDSPSGSQSGSCELTISLGLVTPA
jgi:hypothetical protein